MKVHIAIALAISLCFAATTLAEQSKKSMRAAGRVEAVAQDSITIIAGQDKMTLAVDAATKVIGKGLGTKTRDLKAGGRAPVITDFVKPSDNVIVTYVDAAEGKLRATEINVRQTTK